MDSTSIHNNVHSTPPVMPGYKAVKKETYKKMKMKEFGKKNAKRDTDKVIKAKKRAINREVRHIVKLVKDWKNEDKPS